MAQEIDKAGIVLSTDTAWQNQSETRKTSARTQAKGATLTIEIDLSNVYLPTDGSHRSMDNAETARIHAWLPVDFVIGLAEPDSPVVHVTPVVRDES